MKVKLSLPNRICFSRSSRPDVFYEKGVLKYFAKFTRKHLCQGLFFNKVAGLRLTTLLKKRLWLKCFHVNFAKFLRTPFFTEYLRWLHLPFTLFRLFARPKDAIQIVQEYKMLVKRNNLDTSVIKVPICRFSSKYIFLKILHNSQGNTCSGVSL